MTTHFMIDLETMGTTPQAPILSIGIVAFDPDTGRIDVGREISVDPESAFAGRVPTAATLEWWMAQEPAAQQAAMAEGESMADALESVRRYMADVCSERGRRVVWGNGATFDISMLEDAYRQYDKDIPWAFWNVRDVRTVVDLCKGVIHRDDFPFEGTPHCARDDARHQAHYVSQMWQALRTNLLARTPA